MDDVTFYSRLIESSPAIVIVLIATLVASWRYFLMREERFEQRDVMRSEKLDALTREMLQALHNNTAAMEKLRAAIEGRQ